MDTTDNVSDVMIVITDGFDGDLTALQSASAAVAADGITALGVAYEEGGGLLVSISRQINVDRIFTCGAGQCFFNSFFLLNLERGIYGWVISATNAIIDQSLDYE